MMPVNTSKIGIIGAGNMGHPMAMRMLDEGWNLTVCDRDSANVESLRERGAEVASSPREVADRCALILASLPSIEASLQVALGENGIHLGSAARVYVETSTLGSATIHTIANGLAARGIGLIDAPVSGGPPAARAGTLAVLASGDPRHLDMARPALDALASNLFNLGTKPGISQIAKVINNHVSAAGRLAVFEGLSMGVKAGLDPKILNDVFNAGSARNFTTTHKVPSAILTETFTFSGPLTMALKDEALLLEEAERCGAALWLAPRMLEVFREAAAAGYRDEDGMKLYLYMRSQSLPGGGSQLAAQWREEP